MWLLEEGALSLQVPLLFSFLVVRAVSNYGHPFDVCYRTPESIGLAENRLDRAPLHRQPFASSRLIPRPPLFALRFLPTGTCGGAAEENRQLVADQFAATVGEDRLTGGAEGSKEGGCVYTDQEPGAKMEIPVYIC